MARAVGRVAAGWVAAHIVLGSLATALHVLNAAMRSATVEEMLGRVS